MATQQCSRSKSVFLSDLRTQARVHKHTITKVLYPMGRVLIPMHSNVHSAEMFNCIDLNVVLSFGHLLLLWVLMVVCGCVCLLKADTFGQKAYVMDAWACSRVMVSPFCLSSGHWQAGNNTISTLEHKQVYIMPFVIALKHVWQTDFYDAIYTIICKWFLVVAFELANTHVIK